MLRVSSICLALSLASAACDTAPAATSACPSRGDLEAVHRLVFLAERMADLPERLRFEAEQFRALFQASPCVSPSMHEEFHTRLPEL
jgi:hypothetical protein